MSIFRDRILLLQEQKGVLKKDMAAAIGVTYRGWQYIENEEKEPTMSRLIALADYFGVSVDYLVGRTDNPNINN